MIDFVIKLFISLYNSPLGCAAKCVADFTHTDWCLLFVVGHRQRRFLQRVVGIDLANLLGVLRGLGYRRPDLIACSATQDIKQTRWETWEKSHVGKEGSVTSQAGVEH